MMRPGTLDQLVGIRERARDAAQAALARALAAERRFDEQRRGWRRRMAAEHGARGGDVVGFERWVDACRANEQRTEAQARALKQAVTEAEQAFRRADVAVEQLVTLIQEQRHRQRRAALAREQRWLDDLKRPAAREDLWDAG